MNFPKLTDDLAIISKLGDNPGADDGLTPDGLKAKFDEAALILQAYLNGTLVEMLNEIFAGGDSAPNNGLNMAGPINMNRNPLQNLRSPEAPGEAVNLEYALANFLTIARTINGKPLTTDIVLNAADVGARSATWLPTPAELGAAPESHVENKQNPHEVNCEQIGAASVEYADSKTSMELLWVNASPVSSFAAQTVSLDLSGFDAVLVEYRLMTSTVFVVSAFAKIGTSAFANATSATSGTHFQRVTEAKTNGVVFDGAYNASNMSANNSVMIPQTIYGIKGVPHEIRTES